MHDIRAIRENPETFDAQMARRGLSGVSAEILAIDEIRRSVIKISEDYQAELNQASKEAGRAKAQGKEEEFERLRRLVAQRKVEVAESSRYAKDRQEELSQVLMGLPNAPHDDVPDGEDEADNVEIRRWGEPREFDFAPKEHFDIGGVKPGMDFETAAKLSGSRFVVMRGAIARLHRALAQFMLDVHTTENGLTETITPVLVRDKAMYGTGQLPKFAEDSFVGDWFTGRASRLRRALEYKTDEDIDRIANGEPLQDVVDEILERAPTSEGFWLIPTSEVTLTNTVADEILDADALPVRMTAHTQCFRSEAGSAGKDTSGMLRQHQFEKVEMVSITHPDASRVELERMTGLAENILERLGLPYRTVVLCAGDMGFGARRTHDIEVWLPGQDTYREISSCSVCGDFQARRMNARFRPEPGARPEFVHTLNGSGLAIGRCLIAVVENGQQADGSVLLPEALHGHLGGKSRISADGLLE